MVEFKEFKLNHSVKKIKKKCLLVLMVISAVIMNGCGVFASEENQENSGDTEFSFINDQEESDSQSDKINKNKIEEIETIAKTFVESVYVQNEDNYQERKDNASEIMNEQMLNYFFPSDDYEGKDTRTYVGEISIYPESSGLNNGENIDVIVEFPHTIENTKSEQKEEKQAFIRLELSKKNDQWQVINMQEALGEQNENPAWLG